MKHRCELGFYLHQAFTHASLSRIPLCISWAFLVCGVTELAADHSVMRHDAWNFSGMQQLVGIDNTSSEASVRTDTLDTASQSPATQCQKKSAQSFLGDNANLVNLDNLISFPASSPSRELCLFSHISVLLHSSNTSTN